jgi:4-carboxymuconolactone decarboxylase
MGHRIILFSWIEGTENADFKDHRAALPWPLSNESTARTSMPHDPHYARNSIGDIAPKLAELTDDVLFGDIWARPGLAPRERSIATVSVLIVLNRTEQLPFHLRRARDNGLTAAQLAELITHLAFYGGWPVAFSALDVLRRLDNQ